jgi:hypothetical protein
MTHYKVVVNREGDAEYIVNNDPPRWAWLLLLLNGLILAIQVVFTIKYMQMWLAINENFEMIDAIYQVIGFVKQ